MWFEIIPSFAIVTVAMSLPGIAMYWMNYGVLGNPYRRHLLYRWDRHMYQRDTRLSGGAYKTIGLEGIPDNDNEKS